MLSAKRHIFVGRGLKGEEPKALHALSFADGLSEKENAGAVEYITSFAHPSLLFAQ